MNTEHIFRSMHEMLLEIPAEDIKDLTQTANLRHLSETSRSIAERAIQQSKNAHAEIDDIIFLHKGLNTLLVMLRRRDGLDEAELAKRADIDEAEIRQIEVELGYVPSPRTIYKLEKAFSLPSGVLVKLSGAIKHNSPILVDRVLQFAANAKTIGKLNRSEHQLLNEFVKFLAEKL